MPKISDLRNSEYLTKEDVGKGMLLTIVDCTEERVGKDKELLWCLHFKETEKKMVCKTVNAALIQSFLGGEHTDEWKGKQIVLFNDPTVIMGNRAVGGIRVRAPRVASAPPSPSAPSAPIPVPPPVEDDVPF